MARRLPSPQGRALGVGDRPYSEDERDPEKKAVEGEGLEPLRLLRTELGASPTVCPAQERTPLSPSREQSRQTPRCRRLPHQEYAEGVILFPHNIRLRRGYWAKYIVLIIHINGNSMVTTCHPPD